MARPSQRKFHTSRPLRSTSITVFDIRLEMSVYPLGNLCTHVGRSACADQTCLPSPSYSTTQLAVYNGTRTWPLGNTWMCMPRVDRRNAPTRNDLTTSPLRSKRWYSP